MAVTKLDRLGRNAVDARATAEALAATGIRLHYPALGGVDLTSLAGKMTIQVLNAVAEFERDLLIERTNSGVAKYWSVEASTWEGSIALSKAA